MKNFIFIIVAVLIMFYMFMSIRKNKLDVTQSFIWIIFCICFLVLSIFPKSLDGLAKLLGITYPPTLFLLIAIVLLFIMTFIQSKKIIELQKKIIDLGQELSIVKSNYKKQK